MDTEEKIKCKQAEVNVKVQELEELSHTFKLFKEQLEDFEKRSKDSNSVLQISLGTPQFYQSAQIIVPDCVRRSIIQFVLENKELMCIEYEKQIETKEQEILKLFKE